MNGFLVAERRLSLARLFKAGTSWIEYGTAHPALKSRAKLNRRSATEKIEGFYV